MASWNGNSYPCPMCNGEPSTMPTKEGEFFAFNKYPVTLPNRTEISFEEATTKYLEEYFPNYETDSYKVPAAFSYDQDESLDFATDDEVTEMVPQKVKEKQQRGKAKSKKWKGPRTPQKILEDRRQKEAVENIASVFYSLGKEILGPMFVLSEFKFTNFARNSKIPQHLKKRRSTLNGDHDIVIISRRKGVIFIQVKSMGSTASRTCWQQLKCAFEQLGKDEFAMKSMNADLSFFSSLPMRGFVGIPNLTDEQLSDVNICRDHREIILTASNLRKEHSNEMLCKLFSQQDEREYLLDINEYKLLVSRYVGLASIVKMRTASDAVKSVGGKVSRIILNPDQVNCLQNSERRKIILGDFGTGKSLVLMKKAEEVAKMGENVYLVSFSSVFDCTGRVNTRDVDNLVSQLKRMATPTSTVENKVIVHSFVEHLKHIGKCKSLKYPQTQLKKEFTVHPSIICDVIEESVKQHGRVHYFLDELPMVLMCGEFRKWFESLCEGEKYMFIWIVASPTSINLSKDQDFSAYDKIGDLPEGAYFRKTYLTRWMRTTKSVFQLIQGIREFQGDNIRNVVSHGNIVHGTKPWWLEMGQCLCENVDTPFDCQCVRSRLSIALKKILVNLKGISKDDFTIPVRDNSPKMNIFLTSIVQDACKASSISYRVRGSVVEGEWCWTNGSKSAVTVGNVWSHKGIESKVVIFIDPCGGPIAWKVQPPQWQLWLDFNIAASRSLAHFIIVTWPSEEKRLFEVELGKGYLMVAQDPDPGFEFASPSALQLASELLEGRPNHFWKGNVLEYLLQKGLIEKIEVS